MDEIRQKVIERADIIAEVISKGKDVEIRKSKDGISIAAVTKKVIKDGSNGWEEVSNSLIPTGKPVGLYDNPE